MLYHLFGKLSHDNLEVLLENVLRLNLTTDIDPDKELKARKDPTT